MWEGFDENQIFRVIFNREEHLTIWPIDRDLPLGWQAEGTTGTRQEVLDYIDTIWIPMLPSSLREKIQALKKNQGTE